MKHIKQLSKKAFSYISNKATNPKQKPNDRLIVSHETF